MKNHYNLAQKGLLDISSLVNNTIRKYNMLTQGDKVVVAVSGGPDSTALLHILNHLREEWNLSLIVTHFNHGLRGNESHRDATFVENLAKLLMLPCRVGKGDIYSFKHQMKLSTEEAARILRYQFLEDTLKMEGAQRIALGHTADDQAEDILMKVLRGSGRLGLCGMPPVRDKIFIRPLIEVSRRQIERFLDQYDLSYVTDSSNRDQRFLRNKIRLDLIPLLERTYNPKLRENLVQLSSILRDEEDWLQGIVAQEFLKILKYHDFAKVILDASRFLDLHRALQLRLIRKAVETVKGDLRAIGFNHILDVLKLASQTHPSKMLNLPHGLIVRRSYEHIIFEKRTKEPVDFLYLVSDLKPVVVKEVNKVISFEVVDYNKDLNIEVDKNTAYLDYSKVHFPLIIRNIRAGDRFRPLGMESFKKIKDFLINCKIPKNMRKSIPLLVAGDQIVWVAGLRLDDGVKLTGDTRKVLKVKIHPPLTHGQLF
ncbi:MAG TPA: tRNA lysidine(34) synthetase TilS [Syntrophaceae bacterium]|nr:tRNA lysidine(34) synthetase TilS [Syntrophaceae bacterium]